MIAASRAARAAPDGYTVLLHQVAMAAGMTLYSNLTFDGCSAVRPMPLSATASSTQSRPSATLHPQGDLALFRELAGIAAWR
jgi:hypothetical protein